MAAVRHATICSAVLAATLLAVAPAAAQELECAEGYSESRVLPSGGRNLLRVSSATAMKGFSEPTRERFAQFGPSHRAETIEVWTELVARPNEEDEPDGHRQTELHALFAVKPKGGAVEYYKLADGSIPSIALVNADDAEEEQQPLTTALVRRAAAKSEPVLSLRTDTSSQGANSRYGSSLIDVFDFGVSPPRHKALECSDNSIGGSLALDLAYQPRTSTACEWDGGRRDFICTAVTVSNHGVSRYSQKRATFFTGEELSPNFAGYRFVSSLEDAAALLVTNGDAKIVVAGIGALERLDVSGEKPIYVAESGGELPELRFFAFDRSSAVLAEIEAAEIDDGIDKVNPADDLESSTYQSVGGWDVTEDGSTLHPVAFTTSLKPLFRSEELRVWELRLLRGDAASLYWLGFSRQQPAVLRIATTGSEYVADNIVFRPSSVSQYTVGQGKTFMATATVQPRTWVDYNDDSSESVSECAGSFTIAWRSSNFRAARRSDCTSPRKLVMIDGRGELGAISTTP